MGLWSPFWEVGLFVLRHTVDGREASKREV